MYMGRDSSVGIATRYWLDGPGIESRWGARFSAPVQTGPGGHPASCTMGAGSLLGVKRPGRDADHSPPSKRRGHERVELYLYSPSGLSWPVIGSTFTLHFATALLLQQHKYPESHVMQCIRYGKSPDKKVSRSQYISGLMGIENQVPQCSVHG